MKAIKSKIYFNTDPTPTRWISEWLAYENLPGAAWAELEDLKKQQRKGKLHDLTGFLEFIK